jgi:hypothetical protein
MMDWTIILDVAFILIFAPYHLAKFLQNIIIELFPKMEEYFKLEE